MRTLEDAEQRRADARANSAADKSTNIGTTTRGTGARRREKQLDGHNADERQDPRSEAKSLQKEKLSIHSQGDKTKSSKTSEFSETSNVRRVLALELKASKEHE